MSKRTRPEVDDARPPKRQKPEYAQQQPVDEIHFARQLQQLLSFRQDGIQQLRNGINSFKVFLESILYHRDEDARPRQLSILREYLDTQKPEDPKDVERPFLAQLWQAWSFASQNNNDYLTSSVSAILALLLRTLSSLLDFRDHGMLLCKTVLLHQHLRLVKRGLDAPKHKDFVIQPCLRLLTEATSFDGGALAREVYKRREHTFDVSTLRRNLALVRVDVPEEEARRKPSIRTLTVRYILAHLKYLHEGAKNDLLRSRPLSVALFSHLADDPSDVINDILTVTEQNVLKDDAVQRSAKATLLLHHNLEHVTEVATRSGEQHPSAQRAFAWLKSVCTRENYGILRRSAWYPPGTETHDREQKRNQDTIDLGLDGLDFYDRDDRPDVRNTTLLAWTLTLRPQSDSKERELVITCFESAPELVAAWFAEKNLQLEPKLTNTWIGYASFLFEVIRLQVPERLGYLGDDSQGSEHQHAELPPQTNIIMENLLPGPLTQKVLARCMNQSSDLITFFAERLLVLAFQKLSTIALEMYRLGEASPASKNLWHEARDRLLSRFTEQAPAMKDVINAFRKTPDDEEHVMQRETGARLLRLYYEAAPVQALEEHFDISSALTTALARSESDAAKNEISEMRALELQHLLVIAKYSPGMKWFSKQGGLEYSPLVSLLRLHASDAKNRDLRALLWDIMAQDNLVADENELEALIASLAGKRGSTDQLWVFIDDALARASRQPVKYVDQLEAASGQKLPKAIKKQADFEVASGMPGLLAAAVAEQSAFVKDKAEVVGWVARFLSLTFYSGHTQAAGVLLHGVMEVPGAADVLSQDDAAKEMILHKVCLPERDVAKPSQQSTPSQKPVLDFAPLPAESDNHPELFRWAQKDLTLAFEDGDVTSLILCLCSKHSDIRRQGHIQLRSLAFKLRTSTVDDKDLLCMLLGEVIETFERQCLPEDHQLPYLTGTFATRALNVLQEPTHFIYPKVNRYLIKSPEWRIHRMPTHWLSNTVLGQPEEDDAYWKEVTWVLAWLVDGLRTSADLDILRQGGIFEKVTALYSSPGAVRHRAAREKVLELLHRATCVEGGSTAMVTRAGILAWLDMVSSADDHTGAMLKRKVRETYDETKVNQWQGM
ncbi:hypothetical protein D0860_01284 [Hortaea werneckii]|uniref:Nucleolar pre-ribosomal-associated protein 1 C-terminal domain-containing protein n=1 Tax=Hortaea werneckii TaxID=91943 RepID=A0A3M7HS42_HORWE|nr:hypothetical protein D0860_01284 [Hortaea werneckii]